MNQRTTIAKIYKNQETRNNQLDDFRHKLVTDIYRSLLDKQSYIKRVNKLFAINFNKNMPVNKKASQLAINTYNKILKKSKSNIDIPIMSVFFITMLEKSHINDYTRVQIYKDERKRIGEEKQAFIDKDIINNRANKKIFYLCSSHDDCAKDHKNYQGKLYVDANWQSICPEAKDFINKHKIKTYQWVINKPVWLLTRPHCRHYMTSLTLNEVLNNSVNDLINKYDMHRKIGLRSDNQTMNSKNKDALQMINAYNDRLRLHNELLAIRPNDYLRSLIDKDKTLIRKWQKQL